MVLGRYRARTLPIAVARPNVVSRCHTEVLENNYYAVE